MAEFKASNYTNAYDSSPVVKIGASELYGKVRRSYDSYTLGAELSINDTIRLFKLPKGARLVDARLVAPSDGTTGQLDVGWEANGVDAADQDGIFAGASEGDTGGGAVDSKLAGTAAGWNKKFGAETEILITAAEATTASNGDTIEVEVFYIVE